MCGSAKLKNQKANYLLKLKKYHDEVYKKKT